MPLPAGAKLGPYQIQSPLGAGGMGEVYKAKDTRLDRTVAIKILAAHLSSSSEIKQRFEREARTISSLGWTAPLKAHRTTPTSRSTRSFTPGSANSFPLHPQSNGSHAPRSPGKSGRKA